MKEKSPLLCYAREFVVDAKNREKKNAQRFAIFHDVNIHLIRSFLRRFEIHLP